MRLTTEMRQYIDKKVHQKYEAKLSAAQEECDKAYDKQKELESTCRQLVAEYLTKTSGMEFPQDKVYLDIKNPDSGWGSYQIPEIRSANLKLSNIQSIIREKVDEICMELALGGTKADLDRMLVKLDSEDVEGEVA